MTVHTPSRPRRARTLMAVSLTISVLAGAGAAWMSFDTPAVAQYQAAQTGNTQMYGPPGFADLAPLSIREGPSRKSQINDVSCRPRSAARRGLEERPT